MGRKSKQNPLERFRSNGFFTLMAEGIGLGDGLRECGPCGEMASYTVNIYGAQGKNQGRNICEFGSGLQGVDAKNLYRFGTSIFLLEEYNVGLRTLVIERKNTRSRDQEAHCLALENRQ